MTVQIKIGGRIVVPIQAGWTASSSKPAIAAATVVGSTVVIQALAAGTATLTLGLTSYLRVAVDVTVTMN